LALGRVGVGSVAEPLVGEVLTLFEEVCDAPQPTEATAATSAHAVMGRRRNIRVVMPA
jgi:hypothetical protein